MREESLPEDRKDALSKIKDQVLTILLKKDGIKLRNKSDHALRRTSSATSLNSCFSNDSITSASSERRQVVKSTPFGSPMLPRLIRRFSPRHVKVQRIRSIDTNQTFTLKPALRRESSFGGSTSDSDSAASSPQLGRHVTFSKYALLLAAAADNSVDELRALLDKDPAYINKPSSSGQTPLHKAAIYGHEDSVKLLLERGADVNFADKLGRTPMFLAWEKGHRECFKLMILASKECLNNEIKNGLSHGRI